MSHFDVLGAQTMDSFSGSPFMSPKPSDQYTMWRERLKTRPDWRDGWVMAGKLALESGRFDEALISVNHALLLDPNYEESKMLLSKILDARSK